jgi:hypothetical protein
LSGTEAWAAREEKAAPLWMIRNGLNDMMQTADAWQGGVVYDWADGAGGIPLGTVDQANPLAGLLEDNNPWPTGGPNLYKQSAAEAAKHTLHPSLARLNATLAAIPGVGYGQYEVRVTQNEDVNTAQFGSEGQNNESAGTIEYANLSKTALKGGVLSIRSAAATPPTITVPAGNNQCMVFFAPDTDMHLVLAGNLILTRVQDTCTQDGYIELFAGTLEMKDNVKIDGNHTNNYGVRMRTGSPAFFMRGGEITNCGEAGLDGLGLCMAGSSGTFIMEAGKIYGNRSGSLPYFDQIYPNDIAYFPRGTKAWVTVGRAPPDASYAEELLSDGSADVRILTSGQPLYINGSDHYTWLDYERLNINLIVSLRAERVLP